MADDEYQRVWMTIDDSALVAGLVQLVAHIEGPAASTGRTRAVQQAVVNV